MRPSVTTGPSAKQVRGAPNYAACPLVPARTTEGIEPVVSGAGLVIGHTVPATGGLLSYWPVPLPAVMTGKLVLAVELVVDGEDPNAMAALHWRWLAKGGVPREVYTQPLVVGDLLVHRVPINMEQVDRSKLSLTTALLVTPMSGEPILIRAAWLEMRE